MYYIFIIFKVKKAGLTLSTILNKLKFCLIVLLSWSKLSFGDLLK